MIPNPSLIGRLFLFGTVCVLLSGCTWGHKKELPPEQPPQPMDAPDAILGDTVGSHTLIGGGEPMRLRGFGLVLGLGENGGSDCPSTIREYLLDYLAREFAPRDSSEYHPDFSPREMIDSLDTSVAVVHGIIPAGAPRGTRFDLQVEAVGTQTRSLEGGVLVLCELKQFDVAAAGKGLVSGRTLARARGLVFTSPFKIDREPNPQTNPRRGYVLGGGVTMSDRSFRLLLQEPSYWLARNIERRINERFGQHPPIAKAMSKGYLTITTPPQYGEQPDRFLELVTHLYMNNTPDRVERRLRELSEHLDGPDSTLNHISLIWEGMGRTAISHLQPLYTHPRPSVRFYAARAGLRLKDVNALAPMYLIAENREHANRLAAIRELGNCEYFQAARRLAKLLDSSDQDTRIVAYEGLLKHKHPTVETRRFISAVDPLQYNLTLDLVESAGPPLIYVSCSLEPRIAVFGQRMPIGLPLFYNHPDDWVTLNALEDHGDISIICRTRDGRLMTEPLMIPARVGELLQALAETPPKGRNDQQRGIGLSYTNIVQVLDALCSSGAIQATLALQKTAIADLLGPLDLPERQEGDEIPLLLEERPEQSEDDNLVLPDDTQEDGQRPE